MRLPKYRDAAVQNELAGVMFLSDTNEAHMAFFTQDQRQAKPGILRAQLPGHAAERATCRSDEIVLFAMAVSVLHDIPRITLSWACGQVSD
jgi:hypothetical protein